MWPSIGASGNGACTVEKCLPWVIPRSASRGQDRRGVMKLFHRTTAKSAKTIFAKGFTDATGSFGTRGRYTGVLLTASRLIDTYNSSKSIKNDLLVEGKGFVGHASNNRALLQHARVQNAAEHGTPRNQAQPGFCRCPAGEALLCGPRRRSPGRGSRPSTPSGLGKGGR